MVASGLCAMVEMPILGAVAVSSYEQEEWPAFEKNVHDFLALAVSPGRKDEEEDSWSKTGVH